MSASDEDSSIGSNTDYDTSDERSVDECDSNDSPKKNEDFNYLAACAAEEMFTGQLVEALQKEFPEFYAADSDSDNVDETYFSDQGSKCTYTQGYMKRQNLYTCMDCNKQNNQLSALCFGCTICCHRKHNVIELYSKRNYRCDCGNEKNSAVGCKLNPDKELFNSKNVYNDNFRGVYCVCKQPYDSNSNDGNDVMIQCVICEDWFHTTHLDITPPKDSAGKLAFDEFICFLCSNKYSYLAKYAQLVESNMPEIAAAVDTTLKETDSCADSSFKDKPCVIQNIPLKHPFTSIFMPAGWRNCLCQCANCCQIYQTNGHSFLLDKDDVLVDDDGGAELSDYLSPSATAPSMFDGESSDPETESHEVDQINLKSTLATPSSNTNTDKDTIKNGNKPTENVNAISVSDSSETKHSSETTKENFLNGILNNSKKPVKLNVPDEIIKEFHQSKHPKYDDNQNL